MPNFPERVLIELQFINHAEGYIAKGKYVDGALTFSEDPQVRKPMGLGYTAVEALNNLTEAIVRKESIWPLDRDDLTRPPVPGAKYERWQY